MTGLRYLLALALLAGTAGWVQAEPEYDYCNHECKDCSHYTCKTTVECVDDKKECYEIECKQICIPAIRFPWQKCCAPACGKVITVKSPKKTEKDCGKKKEYKHEIEEVPGCCDGCATGCSACQK